MCYVCRYTCENCRPKSIKCSKCGRKNVLVSEKCSECGHVFVDVERDEVWRIWRMSHEISTVVASEEKNSIDDM